MKFKIFENTDHFESKTLDEHLAKSDIFSLLGVEDDLYYLQPQSY